MVGARILILLKHQSLLRLVDGDKAVLLLRLGMKARAAKARAANARARLRILLLVVLLLLLLVAMLLLLVLREADLVTISVLIVSRRVTTRIRAPIWPPRTRGTRNGQILDGRSCSAACAPRGRADVEIFLN